MGNAQESHNDIYRGKDCPYGQKAVKLLNDQKIPFDDHIFPSKQAEARFKEKHHVKTTPQIFLHGDRIGGYDALVQELGVDGEAVQDDDETSYIPVVAVFGTSALVAAAAGLGMMGFMGIALCALAMLKLMDLQRFTEDFKQYDLITKRVPAYGWVYPFAELLIGLGILSGIAPVAIGVVATFVGVAGGVSIIKAVWIDKKDLNCACVGGGSRAPLGVVSFSENAVMVGMGLFLIFV